MSFRTSGRGTTEDAYWRMLLSRDPASLCKKALVAFDPEKEIYMLRVADLTYVIDLRSRAIVQEGTTDSNNVSWDTRLLVLAYLTGATENSLVGRWVSPIEFSGGDLFFSSDAHNLAFTELLLSFKYPEDFLRAGQKIGGKAYTIGDSSFVLAILPRIPILFIYWAGDEELPSKISVLVDESAHGHLAIDGLWLAIKVSEKRLLQVAKPDRDSNVPI